MLAKLFTKDPMNLRGPSLPKVAYTTFRLSDSDLSFKCPEQTAAIPGVFLGNDLEFDRDSEPEIGDPYNRHCAVFRTGWDFEDGWWKGMTYGGLRMGIYLNHNVWRNNPKESIFRTSNLVEQILQIERNGYIRLSASRANVEDHEITEDDIQSKRFCRLIYPESRNDIRLTLIGKTTWAYFESYFPGSTPEVIYQTAVENNNMVRFIFSQDAFGGIDFFSPKHNLKEACHNLINEIMSTVTLQLSPKAQRQKDEVIAMYGEDEVV